MRHEVYMNALFQDRRDAGRQLATALLPQYDNRKDVRVLGLPRGGVPVAAEVASALNAPLDVLVVRKLGVPQNKEFAMGAIASGGITLLNDEIVRHLGISKQAVDAVIEAERVELLRRERAYRGQAEPIDIRNCTVILVDDGLATGSTMRAAIAAVRNGAPSSVVVAVPVAAHEVCQTIGAQVDSIVCLATPAPFRAVGLWYGSFPQTSDEEVRDLLAKV